MFGPVVTYRIPVRLWRRILSASCGDYQLAYATMATAFLVALDHCASPPVHVSRQLQRPWLDDSYRAREPNEMPAPRFGQGYLEDGSYVVDERPASDLWASSWD